MFIPCLLRVAAFVYGAAMFGFCPLRYVKRESDRPTQITPSKISRKQGSKQAKSNAKKSEKRLRKKLTNP